MHGTAVMLAGLVWIECRQLCIVSQNVIIFKRFEPPSCQSFSCQCFRDVISFLYLYPQVDQLVFKRLIEGQFPRLSAHLDKLGVNAISVSTQWFLCIFVNSLPLETCLRVWDIFFLEKCSSVLYRIALALIDIYAQVNPLLKYSQNISSTFNINHQAQSSSQKCLGSTTNGAMQLSRNTPSLIQLTFNTGTWAAGPHGNNRHNRCLHPAPKYGTAKLWQ